MKTKKVIRLINSPYQVILLKKSNINDNVDSEKKGVETHNTNCCCENGDFEGSIACLFPWYVFQSLQLISILLLCYKERFWQAIMKDKLLRRWIPNPGVP